MPASLDRASRLDSGVTRHDSAAAAGGQGAERPDSPAPYLRPGLGHLVDPLFNLADLGEGLGSLHLLCLVGQVRVHRACSLRSEEHTSELQSHLNIVCRLLLEKKKKKHTDPNNNKKTKKYKNKKT